MTITSVWKKLLGKPRLKVNKPNRLKLGLEHLEDRLTPAIVTWVNPASGDWSVPSNWSTGQLPGSTDDVQINLAGVTVTHSVGSDSVNSLTSSDPIILSGGTLSLASTSAVTANFTESGGTLAGAGNLSIGGLTWSGGSMNGAGQTVLSAGTTGTISGTVNKGLERTLNNFGSITYSGAHL